MTLLAWGYVLNSRGGADCTADMCFGELDGDGYMIAAHRDKCPTAEHERIVDSAVDFVKFAGQLVR